MTDRTTDATALVTGGTLWNRIRIVARLVFAQTTGGRARESG